MDTDSLVSLALETCAAIPQNVDSIFQLWILMHTSAYYLLQNLNYFRTAFEGLFVRTNVQVLPNLFKP